MVIMNYFNSRPAAAILSAAIFSAGSFCQSAQAHVTSANGGNASGPILTNSAQTLAQGKTAISVSYQRFDLDGFSDDFLEDVALAGFEEVHNTDAIQIPSLNLAYGLTNRLELSVVIPLVGRSGIAEGELEEPGEAEVEVLGDSFGFGDITARAQYHALTENHNFADVALSLGIKLPTGGTNELEDDASRFETEFQPGSGSTDVLFGAAIGKSYQAWSLNASAEYTLASRGAQDTDLGDTFEAAAALSYGWALGGGASLSVSGELVFQDQQRESVGDESDVNSGGQQLFIAPGLRYSSGSNWSVFGSIGLPIHEDLNGIQNDTDYRLTTGVSVSF